MVGGGRVCFRTGDTRESHRRQFALCKERPGLSRAGAFLVPVVSSQLGKWQRGSCSANLDRNGEALQSVRC
jgi:hypothetical protein